MFLPLIVAPFHQKFGPAAARWSRRRRHGGGPFGDGGRFPLQWLGGRESVAGPVGNGDFMKISWRFHGDWMVMNSGEQWLIVVVNSGL